MKYFAFKIFIVGSFVAIANCIHAIEYNSEPNYKYHYQTQDVLASDTTTVPLTRGYRVVESEYYPTGIAGAGYMPGYNQRYFEYIPYGMKSPYSGPYFGPVPVYPPQGYGGEFLNRNLYSNAKKHVNDLTLQNTEGGRGEHFDQGNEAYSKGLLAVKNDKGEYGQFNDHSLGNKVHQDEKYLNGGQQFNYGGNNADEVNRQAGHKKGHVIKGFKTSHHKDESGKTEHYYDEADDEGDKFNYNGQQGGFGQKGFTQYKSGYQDGNAVGGGHKKGGHYDGRLFIDNSNSGHGKLDEGRFYQNNDKYAYNNGADQRSFLTHHNTDGSFKNYPPHHLPVHY